MKKMSKSKLDGKIDKIIELILEGDSYRTIAGKLEVALTTLHDFTSKSEHSARAKEALEYSAQSFDDKAEEALLKAPSTMTEIQRARELAQHYRWKASKRNPRRFGDKLDVTTDDQPINKVTVTVIKSDIPLSNNEQDVKLN